MSYMAALFSIVDLKHAHTSSEYCFHLPLGSALSLHHSTQVFDDWPTSEWEKRCGSINWEAAGPSLRGGCS
ncbi:hypothetical protein BOTBODRAFT_68087 [Botryobasidium botryosum FD-172 SS1]|uniref:Uncharacterized protein n=1 Tax=Botryobasidium botryosum (strain FD-172 SS1) TaxID=930990 RepID=A0A067MHQ0_BOTB1|nr:hypothetical protein BOTBODRAFT_68087 [Botryobasidium botryosum FD-172 SS1]